MTGALTLRVITPSSIVLDVQASSVQLPGVDGLIGVLPRHAHMVAAVDSGPLTWVEGGTRKSLFVSEGFAEVKDNTMRVVCEAGEQPSEIDEKRARESERRARERLKAPKAGEVDILRAEAALRRAVARLHVLDLYARERVRS